MKDIIAKTMEAILETEKVDRTAKYKMVKASDEEMEEVKDFINPNEPLYFIEKVLD